MNIIEGLSDPSYSRLRLTTRKTLKYKKAKVPPCIAELVVAYPNCLPDVKKAINEIKTIRARKSPFMGLSKSNSTYKDMVILKVYLDLIQKGINFSGSNNSSILYPPIENKQKRVFHDIKNELFKISSKTSKFKPKPGRCLYFSPIPKNIPMHLVTENTFTSSVYNVITISPRITQNLALDGKILLLQAEEGNSPLCINSGSGYPDYERYIFREPLKLIAYVPSEYYGRHYSKIHDLINNIITGPYHDHILEHSNLYKDILKEKTVKQMVAKKIASKNTSGLEYIQSNFHQYVTKVIVDLILRYLKPEGFFHRSKEDVYFYIDPSSPAFKTQVV